MHECVCVSERKREVRLVGGGGLERGLASDGIQTVMHKSDLKLNSTT